MGAIGTGALLGALYVAGKKSVLGLEKLLSFAGIIFGVSISVFAISRSLLLSLFILMFSGFGMFAQITCSNTILQTLVEDNKRGRIMSLYTMAFMGMVPLGSFYVGALAHYIGAPRTLIINGTMMVITSMLFIKILPKFNKIIHPIYRQKGILPEIAEGLSAAAELASKPED
jgi:MFS family permease